MSGIKPQCLMINLDAQKNCMFCVWCYQGKGYKPDVIPNYCGYLKIKFETDNPNNFTRAEKCSQYSDFSLMICDIEKTLQAKKEIIKRYYRKPEISKFYEEHH